MKKTLKIVMIIAIMFTIVALSTSVFAAGVKSPAEIKANTEGTDGVVNVGQRIIGIVTTVGSVASVLVLVVIGIKYMMGSAEEKAEYKKTLMPYVIGAVLVFAASSIAGVIFNFASNGLV